MSTAITPVRQSMVIGKWLPTMSANGSVGHWSTRQKKHDADQKWALLSAIQAGWQFVPGRVRVTITLVYPKRPTPDPDNTHYKCKGLLDGLKLHTSPWVKGRPGYAPAPLGFFTDDDPDHLELVVRAVVESGVRETRITLEPVQ